MQFLDAGPTINAFTCVAIPVLLAKDFVTYPVPRTLYPVPRGRRAWNTCQIVKAH